VAGVTIAAFGVASNFDVNAVSYISVHVSSRPASRTVPPQRRQFGCVSTGLGDYGPAGPQVVSLIEHVAQITLEAAADLFDSHATRILIHGSHSERRALARARRAAVVAKLEPEYLRARHDAASAWRQSLPEGRGPWLLVGQAIANAAGALVVHSALDDKELQLLLGPWRQAIGAVQPVGPGIRRRVPELTR
jgi:hypothetical protein